MSALLHGKVALVHDGDLAPVVAEALTRAGAQVLSPGLDLTPTADIEVRLSQPEATAWSVTRRMDRNRVIVDVVGLVPGSPAARLIPVGPLTDPGQVGDLVAFLASDQAAYATSGLVVAAVA